MWAKRVIGLVWIVAFCTRLALGEDGSKPEEELLKNMEDKFNAALKESAKKLKVDVDTQAILDEYDIDIGGFQTSKEEVESGPADEWTGHELPFGSLPHQTSQVQLSDGHIKPTTFINRFTLRLTPVHLQGTLAASPGLKSWDPIYLGNAPPAAMSNISVYDSNSEKLPQSTMSMRDFIRSSNSGLFLFDQISSFLMKDLAFPGIFKCDPLLRSLKRHFLTYYKTKIVTEPIIMSDDRLICSVIGQPSYILVAGEQWQSHARNESDINYSAVDFNSHPWLRELSYYNSSRVSPGDCLYVPRGWYVQASYSDVPTSVVIFTWEGVKEKVSKTSCGAQDLKNDHQLLDYSQHFTAVTSERNALDDALIHYFMFYLGQQLASSFTHKQFVRKLKRDEKLFSQLVEWSAEIDEISSELFESLDVNRDGRFSLEDMVDTDTQTRERLVSEIQDRLQDFGSCMDNQQKLKKSKEAVKTATTKPGQKSNAKAPAKVDKSPEADDIAKMFQEELQKEMDKMMQEAGKGSGPPPSRSKKERKKSHQEQGHGDQTQAKSRSSKKHRVEGKMTSEKYKVIDDEEIEILAEDEEIIKIPGQSAAATPAVDQLAADIPVSSTPSEETSTVSPQKAKEEL